MDERVLVVDDVETNRLILEDILQNMGCKPILADSGKKALEMIQESQPQLVLTDISMPGMDGYELCRILKGNEMTKHIPIVFISVFDHPEDIVEGLSLGGEDYITKPFVPEVIEARVGVHLRLYEAKQEMMELNRCLQASVNEQLVQMEQEKKNILYALANIAARNSNESKEHIERMQRNCRVLAQGMQLSPLFEGKISDTFIDTIELSAPLCDIGNIGIPTEILQKKTELTKEEELVLKTHTDIGAQFLKDLYVTNDYNDFILVSADIIHHHHENWDGSGYPDHLKEYEIPLSAQIVAVIERYCSLTKDKSSGREEALEIMKKEAGVKINPDIFDICCKISRQLC